MNLTRSPFSLTASFCRLSVAAAILASFASTQAQETPPPPTQVTPPDQSQPTSPALSPESLRQLLAPIALYPDALVALILPASTAPSDVVLASRYLASNGDPNQISSQSWDPSVQSLAAYPDVVKWMDQNLQWTSSVGEAFIAQPADVMNAIQELRAQAKTAGNLVDTPQQKVVEEEKVIRIVPAEPDYIYAPQYDPDVVYTQSYSQDVGPLVTFGAGFAVGSWLAYDFDWNRHEIYRGDWQPGWDYGHHHGHGGNNNVNVVNINVNSARPWQPSARSRQQVIQQQQNFARVNRNVNVQNNSAAARSVRTVPAPSRANFGNTGTRNHANANPAAANAAPQPNTLNPTTPPNVPGQHGKPLNNANNGNKHGQHGNNLPPASTDPANPQAATSAPPANALPNKHHQGANATTSTGQPLPATAAPGSTTPATSGGKHNQHSGNNPQTQTAPQTQAAPQAQSAHPATDKKHHTAAQNSAPASQAPAAAPQQAPSAPHKHNSPSKENSQPAPQHSQAQPQHQSQSKPQQQASEPQKHQQQPQHQPQKAAPQPQKAAPAAPQKSGNAKKGDGDKKKDNN